MNIETLLNNVDPSIIKTSKEVMTDAKERILRIQRGEERPIKTRYKHLNDNLLGGLFSRVILTVSGMSGFGKSSVLKHIEDDIFNCDLNPNCQNYVLLKTNYEMTSFNLALRRLKEETKVSMSKILKGDLTDKDNERFEETFEKETHPNIFYIEKPLTSEEWYVNVRQFIINHQDKERIVVTFDHLGLIKEKGNEGLKKAMDDTLNYQNELKKEFDNVCFINLSQLNRDLQNRSNDAKNQFPKDSDLFNSSNVQFISDLVIILHNPFKLGLEKYGAFSPKMYPHLHDYMIDPERTTTSFHTKGNVFWHFVKLRQDDNDDKNVNNKLFIERLYPMEKIDRNTPSYKLEVIKSESKLPMMDNTMDLWDDVSSSEDDDDMPF